MKQKTCYIKRDWYLQGHEYRFVDCETGEESLPCNYEMQCVEWAESKGYKIVKKPKTS